MNAFRIKGLIRAVRGCPPEWRLTEAVSKGLESRLARHLESCAACAMVHAEVRAVVAKAPTLSPMDRMSEDSRQRIAATLLGVPTRSDVLPPSTAHTRFSKRLLLCLTGVGVGVAVAATTFLVMVRPGRWTDGASHSAQSSGSGPSELRDGMPSRASIRVIGEAKFSRVQSPPDELVRLDDGSIELQVSPLSQNERFRVAVGDSEVEVKGTHFKVTAAAGQLLAVHVWQGRVQVKSGRGASTTLQVGDDWIAAAAASAPVEDSPLHGRGKLPGNGAPFSGTAVPPDQLAQRSAAAAGSSGSLAPLEQTQSDADNGGAPPRQAAPQPPAGSAISKRLPAPRPARASFEHAWTLLREGDTSAAAREFAQVQRQAAGTAIEEDALYWQAVALGRTTHGRADACKLLREFLLRYPGSSRVGAANVALGWLQLDLGDSDAANEAFVRAAHDPSPQVRASARDGTELIGHRSAPSVSKP